MTPAMILEVVALSFAIAAITGSIISAIISQKQYKKYVRLLMRYAWTKGENVALKNIVNSMLNEAEKND